MARERRACAWGPSLSGAGAGWMNQPRMAAGTAPNGPGRVLRGGSWNNNARNCRAAYRNRNHPDNRNDNIGFRVVVAARALPKDNRALCPESVRSRMHGAWHEEVLALFLSRRLRPVGRPGGRTCVVGPGGSGIPPDVGRTPRPAVLSARQSRSGAKTHSRASRRISRSLSAWRAWPSQLSRRSLMSSQSSRPAA